MRATWPALSWVFCSPCLRLSVPGGGQQRVAVGGPGDGELSAQVAGELEPSEHHPALLARGEARDQLALLQLELRLVDAPARPLFSKTSSVPFGRVMRESVPSSCSVERPSFTRSASPVGEGLALLAHRLPRLRVLLADLGLAGGGVERHLDGLEHQPAARRHGHPLAPAESRSPAAAPVALPLRETNSTLPTSTSTAAASLPTFTETSLCPAPTRVRPKGVRMERATAGSPGAVAASAGTRESTRPRATSSTMPPFAFADDEPGVGANLHGAPTRKAHGRLGARAGLQGVAGAKLADRRRAGLAGALEGHRPAQRLEAGHRLGPLGRRRGAGVRRHGRRPLGAPGQQEQAQRPSGEERAAGHEAGDHFGCRSTLKMAWSPSLTVTDFDWLR